MPRLSLFDLCQADLADRRTVHVILIPLPQRLVLDVYEGGYFFSDLRPDRLTTIVRASVQALTGLVSVQIRFFIVMKAYDPRG